MYGTHQSLTAVHTILTTNDELCLITNGIKFLMIFQDHRVTVSQMLDKDTLKSFQESSSKSVYAGNSSINRLDTSEVSEIDN